jgi:hypothetical protein
MRSLTRDSRSETLVDMRHLTFARKKKHLPEEVFLTDPASIR